MIKSINDQYATSLRISEKKVYIKFAKENFSVLTVCLSTSFKSKSMKPKLYRPKMTALRFLYDKRKQKDAFFIYLSEFYIQINYLMFDFRRYFYRPKKYQWGNFIPSINIMYISRYLFFLYLYNKNRIRMIFLCVKFEIQLKFCWCSWTNEAYSCFYPPSTDDEFCFHILLRSFARESCLGI